MIIKRRHDKASGAGFKRFLGFPNSFLEAACCEIVVDDVKLRKTTNILFSTRVL